VENSRLINTINEKGPDICKNSKTFLQSEMWGIFKSRFGWEARSFIIEWKDKSESTILVLFRKIVPGIKMAYVPWGPELPDSIKADDKVFALAELAKGLVPYLRNVSSFIRFDPFWIIEENQPEYLTKLGFHHASADIQPPDTVLIDLQLSSDKILSSMKPKWRYNIRLAEKKGVKVKEDCNIEVFYSLLKETAVRDGIAIHSAEYYKTLFNLCHEYGKSPENRIRVNLYTASHENDILAAIIILYYNKTAVYLYGASGGIKRNLMAPYALQWQAIQLAKEAGCTVYDMFGIPPDSSPDHSMYGLYLFKTGFGGNIIHRPGSWDYVYKPFLYFLFSTAEALRKKIRNLKKIRQ
jgi:lipid II:glycine glycyltransferase (peptidoglycan interpeptide bridge formation enzyme)